MTTDQQPFTKKLRKTRLSHSYGHRAVNAWGAGDLPAPLAQGDVVFWDGTPNDRLHNMTGPYFVVTYCCSIDDGDAWYARVWDGLRAGGESDRLHIAWADRSDWDEDVNWMAGFALVDTADPVGLAKRERMLADGWSWSPPPRCPTCGHDLPPVPVTDSQYPAT